MKRHEAMYASYRPAHQTKVSTNVGLPSSSPNLLSACYTAYTVEFPSRQIKSNQHMQTPIRTVLYTA